MSSDKIKFKYLWPYLLIALGVGILLVLMVPIVGWIAFAAVGLIGAGLYVLKCK